MKSDFSTSLNSLNLSGTPLLTGVPGEATSVYVGDLSSKTNENRLMLRFSPRATVVSVRLVRDKNTGESFRYAYVNFQSKADALKMIDEFNFTELDGNVIRMMLKEEEHAPNQRANMFVKGLPPSMTARTLYEVVKSYGQVQSIKIPVVEKGSAKLQLNYAFVQFANEESAQVAIEGLSRMNVFGKELQVSLFRPRHEREKTRGVSNRTFMLKFVPKTYTKTELLELLRLGEAHGLSVESVNLLPPKEGREMTVCLIRLEKVEDSDALTHRVQDANAKLAVNGDKESFRFVLEPVKDKVTLIKEKKEHAHKVWTECRERNIFLKNLPKDWDKQKLNDLCTPFGFVESVFLPMVNESTNRGFGFCCFATVESAQKAIRELDGRELSTREIEVCLAKNKREHLRELREKSVMRPFVVNNRGGFQRFVQRRFAPYGRNRKPKSKEETFAEVEQRVAALLGEEKDEHVERVVSVLMKMNNEETVERLMNNQKEFEHVVAEIEQSILDN